MSFNLSAIVLAAGHGTRMRSELPKPLHVLCERPMAAWVLEALTASDVKTIAVVIGHGGEDVSKGLQASVDMPLSFVEQQVQRGTGDAASVGLTGLPDDPTGMADVLVLPGDTPLLRPETIADLVRRHREADSVCTMLTARLPDPTGYGRVLRDTDGGVERIVEHADATAEERAIDEINTSIYCFRQGLLSPALRRITPDNAQGEFYLTDVIEVLRSTGHRVHAHIVEDHVECNGVNDRAQLAAAEVELQRRINVDAMKKGVAMPNPDHVSIGVDVQLGVDVTILPGTSLGGSTVIGDGATIGPNTSLTNCAVGATARVENSTGEDAEVGPAAHVGPYVVLEAGAQVGSQERVAAFTVVPQTDG